MAGSYEKRAVSTGVNSVRNDDPDILAPGRRWNSFELNPSRAARDISLFAHLNSLFSQSNSLFAYFKFPVLSEQGIAI